MTKFNEKTYAGAIEALHNAEQTDEFAADDAKFIEDFMNDCSSYVQRVNEMETSLKLSRFHLDADAYKEKISALDSSRRALHNGIIANLRMLERMMAQYKLPSFFTGDVEDRHQVADFCGEVSKYIYQNRQ